MRILIYTSQFPRPNDLDYAVFTANLAEALRHHCEIIVVCPLPWFPKSKVFNFNPIWNKLASTPVSAEIRGLTVFYPKYLMVPKVSGLLHPFLQRLGSYRTVEKLHQEKPFDVMNVHWIYPDGVAGASIASCLGIPVVLTALGSDINLYSQFKGRRAQIVWALNKANKITTVSEALKNKIVDLGLESKKVVYAPNGVNFKKFQLNGAAEIRKELHLKKEMDYLLFVGRLVEEKGLKVLFRGLKQLQTGGKLTFETVLIGDGPLRSELEKMATELELTRSIHFVGEVCHEEIPKWMAACDVFCLPSFREGMPNVILEAHAAGMPVVASRVGDIPDMIHNESGILVKPEDPEELSNALMNVFKQNWDSDAIKNEMKNKTWVHASKKYLQVFQKVVGSYCKN